MNENEVCPIYKNNGSLISLTVRKNWKWWIIDVINMFCYQPAIFNILDIFSPVTD